MSKCKCLKSPDVIGGFHRGNNNEILCNTCGLSILGSPDTPAPEQGEPDLESRVKEHSPKAYKSIKRISQRMKELETNIAVATKRAEDAEKERDEYKEKAGRMWCSAPDMDWRYKGALAANASLKELLREVEWAQATTTDDTGGQCKFCYKMRYTGEHTDDCKLAKALKRGKND